MNSVQNPREEHNQTEIKLTEYSLISISPTEAMRKNIVSYNQSVEIKLTALVSSCCVSSHLVTGLTVAGGCFINCQAVDGVVLGRRR